MRIYGGMLALVLVAAPASPQTFEVAGLFGYTTEGGLEPTARELDSYAIGGGFTGRGSSISS